MVVRLIMQPVQMYIFRMVQLQQTPLQQLLQLRHRILRQTLRGGRRHPQSCGLKPATPELSTRQPRRTFTAFFGLHSDRNAGNYMQLSNTAAQVPRVLSRNGCCAELRCRDCCRPKWAPERERRTPLISTTQKDPVQRGALGCLHAHKQSHFSDKSAQLPRK